MKEYPLTTSLWFFFRRPVFSDTNEGQLQMYNKDSVKVINNKELVSMQAQHFQFHNVLVEMYFIWMSKNCYLVADIFYISFYSELITEIH